MKIYCLMENTSYNENFLSEHGLSLYIETDNKKILFDTGQTGKFTENAKKLNVDLSKVDFSVLSHGHYDHSGGIKEFFRVNKAAPVYLSEYAFGEHYNADKKYIGISKSLVNNERFIKTGDYLKISDNAELFSANDFNRKYKTDFAGLSCFIDGKYSDDIFLHEQYLVLYENNKKILISGCSHKGILNIVDWFKPDILIGGFHFMKQNVKDDNEYLKNAAKILMENNTVYYTGHCTGTEQFEYIKRIMGDKLNYLASGQFVEI